MSKINVLSYWVGFITLTAMVASPLEAQTLLREYNSRKQQGVEIRDWTYSSDGLKVKGELYLPSGSKRLPLVIFNHDGTSGISKEHRSSSIRLAKEGFVVFSPTYRGEDGSEGQIEIAKGEVRDVLNALTLLKSHSRVLPDEIKLVGASHGALISMLAASQSQDVKAVVTAYGVMDIYKWYAYLKQAGKLGQDRLTRQTYGPGPEKRPQSFAIRNVVSVVDKIDCPVLVLQGALDDIVPPEQANYLQQAMKRANKKVTVKVYPDALHGFLVYAPYIQDASAAEKQQTESAWATMVDFLRKN